MSLRMLFNAARSEEVRAAILRDDVLEVLEIDAARSHLIKGNVYKGKVANVEGSLNACFVEIGVERQGFLPRNDIVADAYHEKPRKEGRPRIEEVIKRGRDVVVQVTRDAVGSKGPALTTQVSLAGRFLVLMPHDASRGISRKIEDEKQRKQLKELAGQLTVPEGMGFIIRTAGEQVNKTALNRDLASLVKLWKKIQREARKAKSPSVLHQEGDLFERMVRDYYSSEVDELIVDTEEAYERVREYFRAVMPRTKGKITLHKERAPLFSHFRLEEQIETIHDRRVKLPSGASIVIDPTEALIAIDVNSGKSTKQRSQEETALKTNMEAASEIARQLRLRDLGGLVVVDFIDMASKSHNRQVERAVKTATKPDKARVYLGRISDNGLMEINRQRIKQSLQLRTHRECPTCSGAGAIPSPEFVAMQIIRRIDARASAGNLTEVHVDLHPELADVLQNHFRNDLVELEESSEIQIFVSGRPGLHRNEQNVTFKQVQGGRNNGGRRGRGSRGQGRGDERGGGTAGRDRQVKDQQARAKQTGDERASGKPARGKQASSKRAMDEQAGGKQAKDEQAKGKQATGKQVRGKQARDGQAKDKPTSDRLGGENGAANPQDGTDQPRLTRSQKRRQRRKRKAERDRLTVQQPQPDQGGPGAATEPAALEEPAARETGDVAEPQAEAAPEKAAPEKAAPEKAAPEKAAPRKAAPKKTPPKKAPPKKTPRPRAQPSVMALLREMEAELAESAGAPKPTDGAPGGLEESPTPAEPGEPATDEAGTSEPAPDGEKPSLVLTEPEEKPKPKRTRRSRGSRGKGRSRSRDTGPAGQLALVDPPEPADPAETGGSGESDKSEESGKSDKSEESGDS